MRLSRIRPLPSGGSQGIATRRSSNALIRAIALALSLAASPVAWAATFTVNSSDDANDGTCNAGHCSLREAIIAANALAGADDIAFAIPGAGVHTISVLVSMLPQLTEAVTIDGYTQPGASANTLAVGSDAAILIQLDGSGLGTGAGLTILASGCTIRGLSITNFPNAGINNPSPTSGHAFEGNFIGLEPDGTTAGGNGGTGIRCAACSMSTLGGTAPGARNVISSNGAHGLAIQNAAPSNTVQGNYIGTDAGGALARPNAQRGIFLSGGGATGNMIGGAAAGAGNLISGNGTEGIRINAAMNTVAGNRIGTNAAGTTAIPNSVGIQLTSGPNTIGGTTAAERNLISGNSTRGILINSGSDNAIIGNFIGTDATGTSAIANGTGILIQNSIKNVIGGTASAARNLISGNTSNGVRIAAGNTATTGNTILGNFIGTDVSGTLPLGNGLGIVLDGGGSVGLTGNTVGGALAGSANVIGAHTDAGILATGANSSGNSIVGNFIGTDLSGISSLPNAEGVRIDGQASIQVQDNRIFNNAAGVSVQDGASGLEGGSSGNCLVFNTAGATNATGASNTFSGNWWGSPDGPSGVGPGTGDSVSADIVFAPFLGVAPAGCPTSTGTISIVEDTVPDGPQDFGFNGTVGNFTLDDDADGTHSNTFTSSAPAGMHSVTQFGIMGFEVTAVSCSDPTADSMTNLATHTATINLSAGETVTCTFQNTQNGTVTIIKDALPDGPQDFAFSGTLGSFSLDDDADAALNNSAALSVAPGVYTSIEGVVAGFVLTGLSCSDPTANTATDIPSATATIDVSPGEAVSCTFENTQNGSITITKDTVPDGPQDFSFSGGLGAFSLDDDADGTLANSLSFIVEPGIYSVTEMLEDGYLLTSLTCVDPTSNTTVGGSTADIAVDPGEDIECTFVNAEEGFAVGIPLQGPLALLILTLALTGTGIWFLKRR